MSKSAPGTPYHDLQSRIGRMMTLGEAEAVLHWDASTMMPPGGAAARAEQLAVITSIRHEMLSAPETGDLIAAASERTDLDPWQVANVHEIKRMWHHAVAVPAELVEALSRASSACETVWREARPAADFAMVLPTLEILLARVREVAAAKAESFGGSPYDALLDAYEPGGRSAEIDVEFDALADFLPGFLHDVLDHQGRAPAVTEPEGPFPVERQRALGVRLMEQLGFDFNHGRLDVSLHPFCGGTPDDLRITTRYDEGDFASALMGVLHETGHALYERGLPQGWRGQPVGEARGMSLHESQSLLIEMQVCRSRPFLNYAAPLIREAFEATGPAWEADNLARLFTTVKADFIRVNADEVTYPSHVILRYRLEKAMIEGSMEAADLPAAWNEEFQRLFGLTPPNDRDGCLQDIHWYDGAWGYFPTYTLGAMTAAQLFAAARAADSAIEPGIEAGDFTPLMTWLGDHVHSKGSSLSTRDLLIEATGKPLDAAVFKAHLRVRYLGSKLI